MQSLRLHDLQFKKTRYSSPNLSKLARADIKVLVHTLFTKQMDFSRFLIVCKQKKIRMINMLGENKVSIFDFFLSDLLFR